MGTNRGECFAYRLPQKAKLKGVIKRLITVVRAVRLTDRVIFDLEMEEIRLETLPPGQAATKIIPIATAVEGRRIITSKKVRAGSSTYCEMTPRITGLGFSASVLKCSGLILSATPNIINAMATFMMLTLPGLKFN
jgi:hypothetical protein